jgi:F0F1-type ATP synthase membrane subunit b/b'
MRIGLTLYQPDIARSVQQEDHFMMDERLTQLELRSDSNATALAALENDMDDRFNRIETELSELRQNKADSDSTLYRLTNMQEEMNRRFGEVKEELQRRATELREHIDEKTKQTRDENERRFAELKEDITRRFNELRQEIDRRFEELRYDMDRHFSEFQHELNRRFAEFSHDLERRLTEAKDETSHQFAQVERHFEQVDKCFDRVETSITDLRKELHHFSRWGLGLLTTIALGAISLVAKAFLG